MSTPLNIVPESSFATPPADLADRLQALIKQCADEAPWAPGLTADSVGIPIIKSLPDMHPGALRVLERVAEILAQQSQR